MAEHRDCPSGGPTEIGAAPDEGCFARAIGTEDRSQCASYGLQREPIQHRAAAESDYQIVDPNGGVGTGHREILDRLTGCSADAVRVRLGAQRLRSEPVEDRPSTSSGHSVGGQDVGEVIGDRFLELLVSARARIPIGSPAVELGGVPKPVAFHVLVAHFDDPFRSQRDE